MYEYIMKHVRKYKSAPSLDAAKHDHPDFEWLQIEDTIDYAIDRFSVIVKRRLADDLLLELGAACNDPERSENIESEFLEVSRKLIAAVPTVEISRFSDIEQRIEEYRQDKEIGKLPGLPFGFPTMDLLTGGLQRHELATVLGFTNVGKSTLLRSFGFNFWVEGYTVLYLSLEMEAKVILRIFDAMLAKLDYKKLKQLALEEEDLERWESFIDHVENRECDIPVIDQYHRITPDQVFSAMVRYEPDVCIIDYVGLMKSANISRGAPKHQQIQEITQDLKHICRTIKIPIIMAAQTNRAGAKDGAELENVGDGISIAQDSDLVFGLHQDEDMMRDEMMEIRVNKNRDGPRGKLQALWRHETQEFRQFTGQDFFKNRKEAVNGHRS